MIVPGLIASAGAFATLTAGYLYGKARTAADAASQVKDASSQADQSAEATRSARRSARQAEAEKEEALRALRDFRVRYGLDRPPLAPKAVLAELVSSTGLLGVAIGDEEGLEREGVGDGALRESLAAMASRALPFPPGEMLLVRMPRGETLGLANLHGRAIVALERSGAFPTFAFERAVYELTQQMDSPAKGLGQPAAANVHAPLTEHARAAGAKWLGLVREGALHVSDVDVGIPTGEELIALRELSDAATWSGRGDAASVEWRRSEGACLYVPDGAWIAGFERYGVDDGTAQAVEGVLRRIPLEEAA